MSERPFDRIGGDALRAVIRDFYDRVFDDVMIGFHFWRSDKARLVEREWQFVANLLGADIAYQGKGMRAAHAGRHILGGQFARRQKILEEVLAAHQVDPEVQRVWLDHNLALRPDITGDQPTECND